MLCLQNLLFTKKRRLELLHLVEEVIASHMVMNIAIRITVGAISNDRIVVSKRQL